MPNKAIFKLEESKSLLSESNCVAFYFKTSPNDIYRQDDCAALDALKSHIVGDSFSAVESDAAYLPPAHHIGQTKPFDTFPAPIVAEPAGYRFGELKELEVDDLG